jgi:hypothetical protein
MALIYLMVVEITMVLMLINLPSVYLLVYVQQAEVTQLLKK